MKLTRLNLVLYVLALAMTLWSIRTALVSESTTVQNNLGFSLVILVLLIGVGGYSAYRWLKDRPQG